MAWDGEKQLVWSLFSRCCCWFHFFHGKPDKGTQRGRAHREGGQLGLDSPDSLKRFSEELIPFAWNKVSVVKITSPRLS